MRVSTVAQTLEQQNDALAAAGVMKTFSDTFSRGPELEVAMVVGGSFGREPGEWTDDTSMATAIAEVAATGSHLRQEEALDAIVKRWGGWAKTAKDVGVQARSVLIRAGQRGISAQTAREQSAACIT